MKKKKSTLLFYVSAEFLAGNNKLESANIIDDIIFIYVVINCLFHYYISSVIQNPNFGNF